MPDDKKRNLHTSVSPATLRLAQAQAALEGRNIGDVIDTAVRRHCGWLADSFDSVTEKANAGGSR